MSVATSALAMLGYTDKAVIVVRRVEARTTASASSLSGLSKLSSSLSAATALPTTGSQELIQVEYNPVSLSITANAYPTAIKSMQQGADAGALIQETRPPSFVLTVELVFDKVNNQDAFYSDYLMLSASSIIGGISSVATTHTVQPQIEGFLATVLNNKLREVSFVWSSMVFTGQVNNATATYTMFNRAGDPIRGTVQFQIFQSLESQASATYWKAALAKMEKGQFKKTALDAISGLTNLSL